ncbi:uncharacterized protein V6R79_008562 [Siganus canaliculatus]
MASSRCCCWILLVLLTVARQEAGLVSGRAVGNAGAASRADADADALRRWRREPPRERCAELAAPWLENAPRVPAEEDADATLLQLRVRASASRASRTSRTSRGLVFPGKSLLSFVRRVYRCCQEGAPCRSVKGIQGRQRGDSDVEFVLAADPVAFTASGVELHLQLSNPQHLDVRPALMALAKRDLPTRYSVRSRGSTLELRVDLLVLFRGLQGPAGGAAGDLLHIRQVLLSDSGSLWGDELLALDLGLVLDCGRAGSAASCRAGGVHLVQAPFVALYYR